VDRVLRRRHLEGFQRSDLNPSRPRTQDVRTLAAMLVTVLASSVTTATPERRIGSGGVSVVLPAGWHTWRPLPGLSSSVTDPVTRVVAISAPFRFAERGCQVAAYAFPSSAVAVVVLEWIRLGRSDHWAPRPERFTTKSLPLHPPPAIECFAGSGGSIQFAQRGRHFGAYLLAGRRARQSLVARARSVLDTLQVVAH